jgi:hypothetical protein
MMPSEWNWARVFPHNARMAGKHIIGAVGAVVAAGVLSGCIHVSNTSSGYKNNSRAVTKTEMVEVMDANKRVELGMSLDEALESYPARLVTLRSSAAIGEHTIEVYQVAAYQSKGASRFERWLYFVDGSLVEVSDLELDWRGDEALLLNWGVR